MQSTTDGMISLTPFAVSYERRETVILDTQYAGEMKKGIFPVINYLKPLQTTMDLSPAECALLFYLSANIGSGNDFLIVFSLNGLGKH